MNSITYKYLKSHFDELIKEEYMKRKVLKKIKTPEFSEKKNEENMPNYYCKPSSNGPMVYNNNVGVKMTEDGTPLPGFQGSTIEETDFYRGLKTLTGNEQIKEVNTRFVNSEYARFEDQMLWGSPKRVKTINMEVEEKVETPLVPKPPLSIELFKENDPCKYAHHNDYEYQEFMSGINKSKRKDKENEHYSKDEELIPQIRTYAASGIELPQFEEDDPILEDDDY